MAQRGMNTMSEGLSSIASMCAELMQYPDADVQFLADLQATVVAKLRAGNAAIPGEADPNQQQPMMAPDGGGGGPQGLPMGMGGPPGMPPGGGVPMGGPGAGPMPNPGELQRVLGMGQ